MTGRPLALLALLLACGAASAKPRPASGALHRAEQWYLDGVVYYENGDWDKALASWGTCYRSAPRDSEAWDDCRAGLVKLGEDPPSPPARSPAAERRAEQAYLEGVVYFQKGDFATAAASWERCTVLAPGGEAASDCRAGLERLDKLYGVTPAP
ncbi:MAG TPA: hypothetical protein VN915_05895 [Elusimicrobiota bacterium]|nr:hypothetical protein [Elusimicrobiota bacterium]